MRSAQGVPSEQIINIDPSNKTRQVLLLQQRKALPSRQSGDDDDDNATAAAQESRIIADRTNIHNYNKDDDDDDGVLPNSASDRRSPLTTSGAGDRPAGARAMQAAAAAATTMPKRYRRDPSPSSSSLSGDSRNSDSADPAPLAENQSGGRANRRAPPVAAAYGWRRSKSEVSASTCSLASLISPGIANKADCARAGQRSCCCGCWWCSCSRGDAADSNQFSSKCRGLSSSAESLSSARCLLPNHNRNHKQNHNTDSDCDANNHRLPKCHSRRRCHKHSSAEHRLQQVALLRKRGDSHTDDHKQQQQQLPPLQQQQEQPTTTSTDTASSALMRPNNCCTLALRCSSSSSGSRSDSQSCCPIKASCAADESYRRCIGSAGRRCLDHHYYDTKAFSSTPSFIGADCSKNALEHTRHQEEDHDDDLEGEKEEQVIIMINGGKLKESSDRKQQQQQVGDISSCGKKYYCGSDSLGADCSLVASSSIGDKTCACLLADKAAAAITSRVATIGQLDKTSTAATCCSPDVSPEQSSFELSSSSSTSSSSSDGSQTQLIRGLSARTTEAILTTAGGRYLQREQQATGAGEHRPAPSSGALAVAIDDAPTVSQQLSAAAKKATDNKISSSLAKSVMDIFSNQTLEDRLRITPLHKGGYPNNTLLVDLSKCHRNITSLWPSQPPASGRGSFSLTNWWPSFLRRPGDGDDECQVNTNCCGSKRRPKKIRRTKLQFHMPDPLLRTDSSLKLEDYDKALCVLTSDVRYHLHLMLYRRIQAAWLLLSTMLCVLLPALLTNLEYLIIVGALTCWLGLQLIGAFVTIQFRSKLNQMLEKSVAQVNSFFMDHNLMLGVINVGCLFSKSKLIIPVLYFDTSQCREQIESIISIDSRKDADGNVDSSKHILDYSRIGLPLTKPNAMALAQSQLAKKIILRYSQRWISYFDKRKLMFTDDRIRPRHLSTGKCLCQFIEEHFGNNGHDNNICEQQPPPSTKLQNHTQPTSASPPPLQTIHTYARTIANPLTINGKPSEQKQQPPQQEIQVRRKVIGKDAAALPTLSKQVSLRDETVAPCRDHLKIDMTDSVDAQAHSQTTGDSHNTKSNGFVLNSWHYLLGTQNEQQVQAVNNSSNLSPVSQQTRTSTTSSPDLSLEMGHDSICRSDVLIRKLRLLLEVRKNDLQGIDGTSLFSDALNKTQLLQPPLSIPNDPICSPPATMDKDGSLSSGKSQANDDSSESNKVNEGKRFYIQKDGLFFFGGGKKNQQQQDRRQSNESRPNALEIC